MQISLAAAIREMRRILIRIWQITVIWHEALVFFTYHPRQGDGAIDARVRVFAGRERVPSAVRSEFLEARGLPLWVALRLRMLLEGATLLYISEGGTLRAYGWLRECDPFVRRYRWLTPRGLLLGYFWVAPGSRGQGLFSPLLSTSIALSRDRRYLPIVVYADVSNPASIRGIEKAGFERLGTYDVTSAAFGFYTRHDTIELNTTIRDVWAEMD